MKKLLSLFVIGFIALVLCCTQSKAVTQNEYGTVVTPDVNLRSEPNQNCEILTVVPLNARLEILELKDNWYHVVYDEYVGYIRSDLVFTNSAGTRSAYVLGDDVKVYGGPSTSSYVIVKLSAGQAVKVRSITGEWFFITVGENCGYVKTDFLTVARPGSTTLEKLLRSGMQGEDVKKLQEELSRRGFLSLASITGFYGDQTRKAVADFQKACGFQSDGIAGDATLESIYDPNNKVTHETAQFNRVKGTVELLDWFEGGSTWIYRGAYFVVTDVKTGLSFNVRRFGGWFHADSEPVTAADTAIMKRIAGGHWSWDRRAIWVTFNGRTVAASMHCMPHMVNPTASNNFDGHFCIHLLHSKVHANSKECPRHQSCVMAAYRAGRAD